MISLFHINYIMCPFGLGFCCVCVCNLHVSFFFLFFFFFFTRFGVMRLLFMHCSLNSSRKCLLSIVNSAFVHCSRTHKFHFSATFSLQMGPMVLFTFKNYFTTVFSVFNFSKISSIQTNPINE